MRRERERQLEVLVELRSLGGAPDFEETVFQLRMRRRGERRASYHETKLLDVKSWRDYVERQRLRRISQPGYRANPTKRDAREMRAMYEAGCPVRTIAEAFHVTSTCVQGILRGDHHRDAGGYTHPPRKRQPGERVRIVRGSAHPRAVLSPELVDRIMSMKGSNRAIARELGIAHQTVGHVKLGRSWVQRAEAAE